MSDRDVTGAPDEPPPLPDLPLQIAWYLAKAGPTETILDVRWTKVPVQVAWYLDGVELEVVSDE